MSNSYRTRQQQGVKKSIRKGIAIALSLLLVSSFLSGCSKKTGQEELLIGAAASLKTVLDEVVTEFTEQYPDIKVSFNYAGSGALEQQIREGAPMDLFLSAGEKQMDSLEKDKLILADTRKDLLENELVLVVPKDSNLGIKDFKDILKASVIAMGDPESVPAGQYSEEVFDNLGIMEEVDRKATYGKDVTEVLNWVSSQNADAGVVYLTDALSSKEVEIAAYAPAQSHSRIIYPAAVIQSSKHREAAESFLDFLKSEKAKKLFVTYGFKTMD